MWKGNPLGCSLPVALEDDDVGSGKIGADGASVLLARTWRCEELVSETREKVESKALSRSRTSLFRIVRSAHTFHAKLSLQNVQFFDRAKEWMLLPSEMFCATSIVDIIGDQAFDPSFSEEKSVEVDISLSVGYQ